METTLKEAINPLAGEAFEIVGNNSIYRRVIVKPAMSGHNSLFVGQIGDWTWETITALCQTNVFSAVNASGNPTYLAFYYFHMKGSAVFHHSALTFGDRLEVISTPFNFGSESVLTLHKIRKERPDDMQQLAIEPEEFYDASRDDCLYVETFNRWVARSREQSNQDLLRSSPVDFKFAHLPCLPERYSPRVICGYARAELTFHDTRSTEYAGLVDDFDTEYAVDVTRDINGVGLVYFAAFFTIIDAALLKLWKHLGRTIPSFLKRVVLDHKLCYLANADIDSVLRITIKSWRKRSVPGHEVFSSVLRDCKTEKVIAVSTMHVLSEVIDHSRS